MKIHYLQHVPFEDLAGIETWARKKGHHLSKTQLFADEEFPPVSGFDWLVILGGPMNIYEEYKYPWLGREKKFIEKAIARGKKILGICLGAQLIADVLGGRVYRNQYKEIGWYPVSLTAEGRDSTIFSTLPHTFTAFHWHGDTFDIPPGAVRTAESQGCANQAFEYGGRVVGIQFHLESAGESIQRLISNCRDEIVQGKYIQTPEEMISNTGDMEELNCLMNSFLDGIEGSSA